MSDDEQDAVVISLQNARERAPIRVTRRENRLCDHEHVCADEESRMIECDDCKAVMDPFDFLWSWASRWAKIGAWVTALKREQRDLAAEVEHLKAERNRLRSSVKGLRGRRGES